MAENTQSELDKFFIEIMKVVRTRSTCDRGRCGSIITRGDRILTIGVIDSPKGSPNCDAVGHEMNEVIHEDGSHSKHCVRSTHAEQNAIVQAAKYGISIDGGTVYTKYVSCAVCAKMLTNAGIVRVVALKHYHTEKQSIQIFTNAGVKVEILSEEEEEYSDKK